MKSKNKKLIALLCCLFLLIIISIVFREFLENEDFFRKEFQMMKDSGSNTYLYNNEKNEKGMKLTLPQEPGDKYFLTLTLMINKKTREYNCYLEVVSPKDKVPSCRLYTKVPMILFESILDNKLPKGLKELLFEEADRYNLDNPKKQSKWMTDIYVSTMLDDAEQPQSK